MSWRSIAQIDHGRKAHFATCTPPGCPAITPKTLAVAQPAEPSPVADADSPPEPALFASLGPGESLVITKTDSTSLPLPALSTSQRVAAMPLVVTEVVVNFPFGSAVLAPAARATIDPAAEVDGIRRIDIRGRTDNVGPAAANEALARERAAAVAQYLHMRHPQVATAALSVDARGTCCYATANDSPEGRARNRRVEIAFGRDPADL